MSIPINPFSVLIPAAGYSQRMGSPKLLLPFGNHTFCEEIVERYNQAGAEKIVFVINNHLVPECEAIGRKFNNQPTFIVNDNPSLGRLRSVQIGLSCIPRSIPCFLQNSDNPFVNHIMLLDLLKESKPDNTVIPLFNKQPGHPVLIGENIIKNLMDCSNPAAILRSELEKYIIKHVETTVPEILLNINTPDDYLRIFGKPLQ